MVPRLGPRNLKINLGNPPKVLRKAPYQLSVFWPDFLTRSARNSIKGSENAYSALESTNTASKNIGAWIGWLRHIINQKTCPCHDPIGPKPPTKLKFFFFIQNYTTPVVITGFEQLSSSICCRVIWLAKIFHERANYTFSEKFWIRPKTGFLTHNFDYRYASESIQGSRDADFDLVFNKTLSQKSGSMGWGPGPAKCGQNLKKHAFFVTSPPEIPPKTKNVFFRFWLQDLLKPWMVWIAP